MSEGRNADIETHKSSAWVPSGKRNVQKKADLQAGTIKTACIHEDAIFFTASMTSATGGQHQAISPDQSWENALTPLVWGAFPKE